MVKDSNYLHHCNVQKCKYIFVFPHNHSSLKGLSYKSFHAKWELWMMHWYTIIWMFIMDVITDENEYTVKSLI